MSFWNLSDGEAVTETATKEFDGGGGNMPPIPEGTSVLAMPDEAKWAEDRDNNEYLSIRWHVMKPDAYGNRKIFQKIWCTDGDPRAKDPQKKRDKALKMLAAIDANAGGKLGRKAGKPSDDDLALALINKQMVLRLGEYSMDGDQGGKIEGNYIQAVGSKDKPVSDVKAAPRRASAKPRTETAFDDDEDSVPF